MPCNTMCSKRVSIRLLHKALPIWAPALAMLAIALVASGCSRKTSHAAQSQPVAQTAVQAESQPDMQALDQAARLWMIRNRRRPTDWDDFAAHAGIQIPPPPPGKKYYLTKDMRVLLEDR